MILEDGMSLKSALVVVAVIGLVVFVRAETPVENSVETQFQLDLHAPDDTASLVRAIKSEPR